MTAGRVGMALAAGKGTRMRPYTDDRPKPLVRVAGKALVDYALDRLAAAGAERAVVNVHHFADMMEAHLETRTGVPDITVSDERTRLLETGGGLVKARSHLGNDPILVTNTDAIFVGPDGALAALFADFDPAVEDLRLILIPKDKASGMDGAGDFYLGGDRRLSWRDAAGAPYFYTGMQIMNPAVLDGLPEEPFSMTRIWNAAMDAGRLTGAVYPGEWLHVGDPPGLAAAEARLAGGALRAGAGR